MGELSVFIIWLVVLAVFLQVDFIFYIVYVCLGVYGWSRWYTPRAATGLRLTRDYQDHAFLGEEVSVTLSLRNTRRLPLPWLQIAESIPPVLQTGPPPRFAFSLPGRGQTTFTYHIRAGRRGYYRLGPLLLNSGDYFGLREIHRTFPVSYLTVYPRITPLNQLGLPSRLPFGTIRSKQRLFEDPARPVGVRDFRSGDSLRQINWKVSAHASGNTNALKVKTFEPAISLDTAILLNLARADYQRKFLQPNTEWAIEVAASLAAHLANQRQAVGLMTNGADPLCLTLAPPTAEAPGERLAFDEASGRLLLDGANGNEPASPAGQLLPLSIPLRPGRAHLMKILELLARIEPGYDPPFLAWAPRACLPLSWGVTILTITPRGDEATCNMLHRLVRAGYNPVLVVIEPTTNFGIVRERARRLGFSAYHVAQRSDLDTWQRPRPVVFRPAGR